MDLREEVRFVVAPSRRGVSPERLGVDGWCPVIRPLVGEGPEYVCPTPSRGRGVGVMVAIPPSHRLFEPRLGATTHRTSARSFS